MVANESIANYIAMNEMNILLNAQGFNIDAPNRFFTLAVLVGRSLRNGFSVGYYPSPNNFDENGLPKMSFPYTTIREGGWLEGGPGNFNFIVPFMGTDVEMPVDQAYIEGQFVLSSQDVTRFELNNVLVSGRIDKTALRDGLILLDPIIVMLIENLLVADIDRDGDGMGDEYSVCLRLTFDGFDLRYPDPQPEPNPED